MVENSKEKDMSLLSDAEILKNRPLPDVREKIATKVAVYFDKGVFDEAESSIACEILRLLSRDVEVRVRRTISESLKRSKTLPRDIALQLAQDVVEVSLPILEFSSVLNDKDLVDIIKSTQQVAKLVAITKREQLSEAVSGELVATKQEDVVVSLFANDKANISEASIETAINSFKSSGKVIDSLIYRGNLNIGIVEKILNTVSGEIRSELINRHQLDVRLANQIARASQERVTLSFLEEEKAPSQAIEIIQKPVTPGIRVIQTENLVNHLYREGRLTESLIFRALCEGNVLFFETSMAKRAGIPIINARTLIHDSNDIAMKSLWKRAKMPDSAFDAMKILINFAFSNPVTEGHSNAYRNHLLAYIQENSYDKTIPLMPYFLAIIASSVEINDVV